MVQALACAASTSASWPTVGDGLAVDLADEVARLQANVAA